MSLRARIHNKKNVAAGLLFAAIGLATIVGASDYPLGTMRSIGPGYFPIMIGIVLALLGAGVAFQGMSFSGMADARPVLAKHDQEDDDGIAIRPLIMITLAVVAFGVTFARSGWPSRQSRSSLSQLARRTRIRIAQGRLCCQSA